MPRNLHHSNLLIGAPPDAESYLRRVCENLTIKLANNPDFFAFRMNTFGIDEARDLRTLAARRAIKDKKIFFISSETLTREAQNALLKTFEEPFPDTYFFLVAREEAQIIPTLLSRMQSIRIHGGDTSVGQEVEKFLSLPLKGRILFAKKFALEERSLVNFLDELLVLLRKLGRGRLEVESVYKIRDFARDSGALPRLIIEHLSLVLS